MKLSDLRAELLRRLQEPAWKADEVALYLQWARAREWDNITLEREAAQRRLIQLRTDLLLFYGQPPTDSVH